MYRTTFALKRFLLITGDLLAFQLALIATLWIRYGGLQPAIWKQHAAAFAWVSAFWLIGLFVSGLYDIAKTRNGLAFFRMFLEGMLVNLLVAFAFFYLVNVFGIAPRANLLLYFAFALLLTYAWRIAFNRYSTRGVFRNRLLFVGPWEDARTLHELLNGNTLGFSLAAVIPTTERPAASPSGSDAEPNMEISGIRWEPRLDALEQIIREEHIQTVVPGLHWDEIPELRDALYRTLFSSVAIMDRRELEEAVTGRIPLATVGKVWFLEHLRESEKAWYETVKRGFDVVLAVPFGFLTVAITPVVALLIKASSPGPVLFSQQRVGKGGRTFAIWKFRTMRTDAEKDGPRFTTSAKTDPRLFPVGRLLRQLRVDELPQIWNVLKGDLSFVGPRPERPEFVGPLVERMPWYALRHLTRPGLTGWAQVQFLTPTASLDDNLKKLQYDLYYIKHRSLILDAAILLKTIGIVLRRQGT